MDAVSKRVARASYRAARRVDAHPCGRLLVLAPPRRIWNARQDPSRAAPGMTNANGGEFPWERSAPLRRLIRATAGSLIEEFGVLKRIRAAAAVVDALPQAPAACSDDDSMPAIEETSQPEVGSLLVGHPVSCIGQPSLHQAVILIVRRDSHHVMGLCLNKSRASKLRQLSPSGQALQPFLDHTVHSGGDVEAGQLFFLHHTADVKGSARIADGVWVGGALEALKDTHILAGYTGWDPEQLKIEIERQVWRVAKGDVEKIVRWCVSNQADAWSKLLGQLSGLDVQPLQNLPSKEVTELLNVHYELVGT